MTRPYRIALIAAGSIILILLLVVLGGVAVVRSQWFRDQVRDRIVAEVEKSTGGRVEIGSFDFDWHTLTATVNGFTVHGLESAQEPPLLHADRITVGLKIISVLKRDVDIALLRVDKPQVYLTIATNGKTNIPEPKIKREGKPAVDTILDLAIKRFEINNGLAQVRSAGDPPKTQPYEARGQNLRALFTYDMLTPKYHGDVSIQPLDLSYGTYKPVPVNVSTTLDIERNRLVVQTADLTSGDTTIHVSGQMQNFSAPVITADYRAKVSVAQVGDILNLKTRQSGTIEASGNASFKSANDFALKGDVKAYGLEYRGSGVALRNVRAQANLDAGPKSASINGIRVYALGGEVAGKAVLEEYERFRLNADLRHFPVSQVAGLATRQRLPYDGLISGPVFAEGSFSELKNNNLKATARLTIAPTGHGVPVNGLIDAKYSGARDTLDLGSSFVALPNTRLDFAGVLGKQLQIELVSTNLNDLLPALATAAKPGEPAPTMPVSVTPTGSISFKGTVTGKLQNPVLSGHLAGNQFIVQDQTIDSVAADITASKTNVTLANGTLHEGTVAATFSGSAGLRNWEPEDNQAVTARLGITNAAMEDLLKLAGQKQTPVTGTLNASAAISGTIGNPQATADVTLANGQIQEEPYDRLTVHLDAPNRTTQNVNAQLRAGNKQLEATASYSHAANQIIPGRLTFNVKTNEVAFAEVATLRQARPDLSGRARLNAEGMADIIREPDGSAGFRIIRVDANSSAQELALGGRMLGDLNLTANTLTTKPGSLPVVNIKLRSTLASATITGDGRWTLGGDYPGTATVEFQNVNLDTMRRVMLTPEQAASAPLGGSVEGSVSIDGPALKPELMKATLLIPRLEVRPEQSVKGAATGTNNLVLRNAEPIRMRLENRVVRVDSARFTAPDSQFQLTGEANLGPQQNLALRLNGNINLSILHMFNADIVSSGNIVTNASMGGSFKDPRLNGTVELKNANLAMIDVPNGLSNANGTIELSGTQVRLRNITAESGGGRVRFTGFATIGGGSPNFRLHATADGVRVRYPEGVSTVADANLNLIGTTQRSVISGTVTIERLAFNPKTDMGSLLSSASAPPQTPSAQSPLTSNMQFDVEIQTAPDITFESGLTQSLEADANLRLRGSLSNPVVLGRVNITQGEMNFFGNKYTINQGSVSFYNPVKLEPVVNIDLETVARGVDVTITVSGPVGKLNVTYRSDPPLQFADIVGLLATGRTPNDATIAARQPTAPQQSWEQMGASALVGQAIANPVAGRLQRFFGVSKLKIDPTISGVTGNPQAKVTLEQQITPDITFTYITDVANAESQVIRIEWAFSKNWSALAVRDENGQFGMDFLYKRRFK